MDKYQGTLFDLPPATKPDPHAGVDMLNLEKLAILYTATNKGNNSGIRFMMTLYDAMAWCEHPESKGQLHGTHWAYFFTRVSNFINCYWMGEKPVIDLNNALDDMSWDERIEKLGLKKISLWEFPTVLSPLGVDVINVPSKILSEIAHGKNKPNDINQRERSDTLD